jgi:hypothetical protein
MRIVDSNMSLQAQSSVWRHETTVATARAWIGAAPGNAAPSRAVAAPTPVAQVSASAFADALDTPPSAVSGTDPGEETQDDLDPRTRLLAILVEQLTGRKVEVFSAAKLHAQAEVDAAPMQSAAQDAPAAPAPDPGWGVEIRTSTTTVAGESAQMAATGNVTTSDGRTIDFSVTLAMSREKVTVSQFDLVAGNAKKQDPLALSLDGRAATLGQGGTPIDLDGDGTQELLPVLAGSAWLVRDVNADGKLSGAGELLGPTSGDGFADLSKLDADHNGWIDSGDPAFAELRLYSGDPRGSLVDLAKANVGAISLERGTTPYTLETPTGADAARIRSTGVWLSEDGQAKPVQQIDVLT